MQALKFHAEPDFDPSILSADMAALRAGERIRMLYDRLGDHLREIDCAAVHRRRGARADPGRFLHDLHRGFGDHLAGTGHLVTIGYLW